MALLNTYKFFKKNILNISKSEIKKVNVKSKKDRERLYKVDCIGSFLASFHTQKSPNTFSITVHLTEYVDSEILQQAVDNIVMRLPFINVNLKKGFFFFYHKIREERLQVNALDANNLLKVLCYGRSIVLETMHSVCDGQGLAQIAKSLITRYFELQGIVIDKADIIDCEHLFDHKEKDDPCEQYGKNKSNIFYSTQRTFVSAYQPNGKHLTIPQIETHKMELDKIKSEANKYGITLNEYLMCYISKIIDADRKKDKSKKKISIMITFDCRRIFSKCKTLCNFVSGMPIVIHETQDIAAMIKEIQKQTSKINEKLILADIKIIRALRKIFYFLPRVVTNFFLVRAGKFITGKLSATFSNIGLVKFPKEIEDKIDYMELVPHAFPYTPYWFCCISSGNTVALSVTKKCECT